MKTLGCCDRSNLSVIPALCTNRKYVTQYALESTSGIPAASNTACALNSDVR